MRYLLMLALLNFIGFLTLPVYYGQQISVTNPLLWLFVPDCQLSALFFSVSILMIYLRKGKEWFIQLGLASSLKYGLWTLIVMLYRIDFYFNGLDYWIIIIAHLFLMIQPLIFIKRFKLSKQSITAFTFLFINDLIDYTLGTHPPLPTDFVKAMSLITPLTTMITLSLSYINSRLFD